MKKFSTHTLFLMAAMILLPSEAFAAALACLGPTPVSGSTLFDSTKYCTGITGIQDIFSGLVCDYNSIINDILSRVYCSIQDAVSMPIKLAATLYIAILGLQILMGYASLSAFDMMWRAVKLTLIVAFATEAAYGINVAYNFFIGAMNDGISWVLGALMPPATGLTNQFCSPPMPNASLPSEMNAFRYMDYLVCKSVTGPFTEQGAKLAGFIAVLSYIVPPVFLLYVYFTITALKILVRGLISYLLSVSAIAFLIALGPIFLGLALFRATYHFFDDWMRFLISFTLQIVLVFAGIAMWLTVVNTLGTFFDNLVNLIIPIKDVGILAGGVNSPVDSWGICRETVPNPMGGPETPNIVMAWNNATFSMTATCLDTSFYHYPSELPKAAKLLFWMVMNLLTLSTVAYVFDALVSHIPELARQLAGPSYTPSLGSAGPIKFSNLTGGGGGGGFSDEFRRRKRASETGSSSSNTQQFAPNVGGRR